VPTQAVFYRDEKGREPVREFLHARLTPNAWQLLKEQIEEMNGLPDKSPPLAYPQTSQIEGPLRELRCHVGSTHFRILYRRSGNLFVLLHMIRKDSRTVARRDIELAQRRWLDFKHRMDATDRRGPRPVGKDAP
jgi:phage-related protein